jgi:Dolichyl-phosphate-mannose-protein mannosyltransferase/Bacterial transcriptional activator domain
MHDAAGAQAASAREARSQRAWRAFAGLAGVCLLALCLRLAYLWETSQGPFGEPGYLPIDARLYHAWAIDWLAGKWPPPQTYYRPPLYTWFTGLIYAAAGPDPMAVKIVQSVLGAATSALVWAIGRELFPGSAVPLLAAAIWAVCGTSIFFDAQLLPGSLDAFLQTALVWQLLVAGRTRRLAAWSFAGLLVGLCALHRGGALLLLPLLLIWIHLLPGWASQSRTSATSPSGRSWRSFAPQALALLVPVLLVIAPVAWRNASYDRLLEGKAEPLETARRLATGRFVSIAESSAVNLRLGNAPVLRELNHVTHRDHFVVWDRLMGEPYRSGIGSTAEANRFILRETLREVAEHPVAWLGIMLDKARELVNGAEIPRNTSIYPDRKYSRVLRVLLWKHGLAFPSGLIIPFGLAGIWLVRRSLRAHFVPLACLAVQALFVLAFFVTARYRLPSLPLLSLYAAHAGLTLLALAREGRRAEAARLGGLLALLLLVSNHAVGAMPASHWPLEHADLARTLIARHELRGGEAQLRAALAQDPGFPAANDQLCALLIYADRAPEAVPSCTRAVASQPESADLHHQLGVALEASGRRPAAIAEYRMALRLAPGNPRSADALAKALEKRARREKDDRP